jgi:hypothetical protein
MYRVWRFLCAHPMTLTLAAFPLLGGLIMFHG